MHSPHGDIERNAVVCVALSILCIISREFMRGLSECRHYCQSGINLFPKFVSYRILFFLIPAHRHLPLFFQWLKTVSLSTVGVMARTLEQLKLLILCQREKPEKSHPVVSQQ